MDSTIPTGSGNTYSIQQSTNIVRRDSSLSDKVKPEKIEQATVKSIAQIHEFQEIAIKELNQAMEAIQGPQKTLQISIHEKTQAIMIKVINKETGDLIREVPSEKILDVVAKMMELNGILIDKRI